MEKRQNYSRKREAILSAICSTTTHPTAAWIYQKLKPEYPDLSLGTVYRNIARFKEDGVIVSVGVVDGQERLDGTVTPHAHFICSQCGSVLDVDLTQDKNLNRYVGEKLNCRIDSHDLVFRGVCAQCLQSRKNAG